MPGILKNLKSPLVALLLLFAAPGCNSKSQPAQNPDGPGAKTAPDQPDAAVEPPAEEAPLDSDSAGNSASCCCEMGTENPMPHPAERERMSIEECQSYGECVGDDLCE